MHLELFLHLAKHAPIDILIGMLKENITNYEKDKKNPNLLKMVEMSCTLITAKDSLKGKTVKELTDQYEQYEVLKKYSSGQN